MNKLTRDIAARFKISLDQAKKIQDILEGFGLDLSEISQRQLNKELDQAFKIYNNPNVRG
jgi:hypothetical protein